jgi:uncharacterized protein
MNLVEGYRQARRLEDLARLRRVIALRALLAEGHSQREIATSLGVSQPAISQQLTCAPDLGEVHPDELLDAAAPILVELAAAHGYRKLAVFGSVARGQATSDSDIDLLVEAPLGTSSFDFIRFHQLIEHVLGRKVDLVDYGGLTPHLDADIMSEAVPL